MNYLFDVKDWTVHHKPIWKKYLDELVSSNPAIKIVEIGSFEGRSTLFFADYLQEEGAFLHCIDTWQGGEEIVRTNLPFNMKQVEDNFDWNIAHHQYSKRIVKHKDSSERGLFSLGGDFYRKVDFLYVDGSHTQRDTLFDVVIGASLVKPGGVMIVDDYLNNMATNNPKLRPKTAVDFIATTLEHEFLFTVAPEPSRQAIFIRKKNV